MEFQVLGPLEVHDHGRALELGGPKPRALLTILLLRAGAVVSADQLIDELWSEAPPRSAHHLLHVYVSSLRKALEPAGGDGFSPVLVTRAPGYLLEVGPDELDSSRFERLLAEGRRLLAIENHEGSAAVLRAALDLWRGAALADFTYEPFAQAEIAHLEELRLVALEERIEADLALGLHLDLLGELEALVADNPLRERPRGQLMLALYRSARQADALEAYREGRRVLVEELGIEPSPSLQRLQQAILHQDAGLELVADLEARPLVQPARKLVTVVVAGLTDSADLDRLDPEARKSAVARALDAATVVLARHGAMVKRSFGEAVMGVFGVPEAHEDDALRGAKAATEVRETLAGESLKLKRVGGVTTLSRLGIETGEVVVEGDSIDGETVARAVRLSQAARPGEVLLGEATYRLVSHAVLAEAEHAPVPQGAGLVGPHRLLAVLPEATAFPRRFDSPIVGRDSELGQLRQAFAQAVHDMQPRLVTVIGEAGVGKSRLTREFASSLGDRATALVGRCVSYGEGITFWPLKEIVQQAAGGVTREAVLRLLGEDDEREAVAALVTAAIGAAEATGTRDEAFRAFARLFEAAAHKRPLLLVFEDIQWGEPTFLDLVEYLAGSARDAPVLVLCLARPELLEDRPSWSEGRPTATTLQLEPLSDSDSHTLIDNLMGEGRLPPEAGGRIVTAAEGNPFFLEQMFAMIAEKQRPQELALPPTVRAVLAARLDRLGPAERAVLECASVVGREFDEAAVAAILPEQARPSAYRHLRTLLHKQYIDPDRSAVPGKKGFRFRHILIQEAAYRAIAKKLRAELHERLADWLEQELDGRIGEYAEVVGYHLEQAWRYRTELATADEHTRELAVRAAEHLWAAARMASARLDFPAAGNLFDRAVSLLPNEETGALLQEFGAALARNEEHERAGSVLARAIERAVATDNARTELHARLDRWWIRLPTLSGMSLSEEMAREVELIIRDLDKADDDLGLTKAWQLLAWGNQTQCRFRPTQDRLEQALLHARRAGERLEESEIKVELLSGLYQGPTPVDEGIRRCEQAREEATGDRMVEAAAFAFGGVLRAMLGRFEEAHKLLARSKAISEDLPYLNFHRMFLLWDVEMLKADPVAAERWLRTEADALPPAWEWIRSLVAAALAQAICAQGRYEEAERLTEVSEEIAGDWILAQVLWRDARATALARRGELDLAEGLGREAVSLAERTDALNLHGDALMGLAEVFRLANRTREAAPLVEDALHLYRRKGNTVMAHRACDLRRDLGRS